MSKHYCKCGKQAMYYWHGCQYGHTYLEDEDDQVRFVLLDGDGWHQDEGSSHWECPDCGEIGSVVK